MEEKMLISLLVKLGVEKEEIINFITNPDEELLSKVNEIEESLKEIRYEDFLDDLERLGVDLSIPANSVCVKNDDAINLSMISKNTLIDCMKSIAIARGDMGIACYILRRYPEEVKGYYATQTDRPKKEI